MKKSIVYSSVTGNTKMLAEEIHKNLGSVEYCGSISDEAMNSELIFVGFWTTKFSCPDNVKNFLAKLNNKKIFLFGTAGYDNSEEFFANIINDVKNNINSSNEIVGSFMCQGKVSQTKQNAIKEMDIDKFNAMKPKLDESMHHPDNTDLENLIKEVNKVI